MTPTADRRVTEVAVGVLIRPDRAVLLADRPAGKPYAGYWEFPGGKVEPGESVAAALARELREEIGIAIQGSSPWVTFEFDYPHAYVRLHFERVYEWHGTPRAQEGQRLDFYRFGDTTPSPLLPAAIPALRWLRLPDLLVMASGASHIGPVLDTNRLRKGGPRPAGEWVGAYAEDRADIDRSVKLQCDFALVGPVAADAPMNGTPPLGWEGFAAIVCSTPLPVYAFGGVAAGDLAKARRHGAHGIAVSVPAE